MPTTSTCCFVAAVVNVLSLGVQVVNDLVVGLWVVVWSKQSRFDSVCHIVSLLQVSEAVKVRECPEVHAVQVPPTLLHLVVQQW